MCIDISKNKNFRFLDKVEKYDWNSDDWVLPIFPIMDQARPIFSSEGIRCGFQLGLSTNAGQTVKVPPKSGKLEKL